MSENKNKFYTAKKTVGGTEYTAQFNGLSEYLRALDELYVSDDSRNISTGKLTEYVLKHVIVEPKGLTPDDFLSLDELHQVVTFGRDVAQGKFRPEKTGT